MRVPLPQGLCPVDAWNQPLNGVCFVGVPGGAGVQISLMDYPVPSSFNTTRMMTTTIRIWIQLPAFGNLGLIFPPKAPRSQSTNRIMMIVHNMIFLLLIPLYPIQGIH